MAIERIYDQSVGQLAGVKVTSTGLGQMKRDGTEAFAQAVVAVNGSGVQTDLATEATQLDVLADLDALVTAAQSTTTVNVAPDTTTIMSGSTALVPKFAAISASASGDLVALVASKKIRVVSFFIVVTSAVTVKLQSGASSDLTGAMPFGANGGISLPYNPNGWFQTVAGEKLNMVLGSGVAVAGGLSYIEV